MNMGLTPAEKAQQSALGQIELLFKLRESDSGRLMAMGVELMNQKKDPEKDPVYKRLSEKIAAADQNLDRLRDAYRKKYG